MAANSDIHLYTTGTPNGIKVSILLEELGLSYKVLSQLATPKSRFPLADKAEGHQDRPGQE